MRLSRPAILVGVYLGALSLGVFLINGEGTSTWIDEAFACALLPVAFIGCVRASRELRRVLWPFAFYFALLAASTGMTLLRQTIPEMPSMAPALATALDAKFLVLVISLCYLSQQSPPQQVAVDVCRSVVAVAMINGLAILRDVVSGGTSLAGLALSPSPLWGFIPNGLFSHKYQAATLCASGVAAGTTLYLRSRTWSALLCCFSLGIMLVLCISAKELVVIGAAISVSAVYRYRSSALATRRPEARATLAIASVGAVCVLLVAIAFGTSSILMERYEAYILDSNTVRSTMYWASTQIASDYFPFGSGAGTFGSQPSRAMYFSPLYQDYGISSMFGGSAMFPEYLMDTWWPKVIAEAGFIGGGAYLFGVLVPLLRVGRSFAVKPSMTNVLGVLTGVLVVSSSIGSALFTSDVGLVPVAVFLLTCVLDVRSVAAGKVEQRPNPRNHALALRGNRPVNSALAATGEPGK